jgi:hypothetical protein
MPNKTPFSEGEDIPSFSYLCYNAFIQKPKANGVTAEAVTNY